MGSQGWRLTRDVVVRTVAVAGAAVSLVVLAVAATRQPDGRLVRARHDVQSPSGRFVARVDVETTPEGARSWRPVVMDRSGRLVYRSEGVLAERSAPRILWEEGLDTLWVVSEAGTAFVQEGLHGWSATTLGSDDDHLVPAGVRA